MHLSTQWDPLLNIDAGEKVAIPMYMHRDAHILLFFFLYLLLTGLIGCIPSKISFSPAWLVLIVWVALLPPIFGQLVTMERSRRLGNDIMYTRWIDSLTPDQETVLPRKIRLMKRVNHGPIWTCAQLGTGLVFVVIGAKQFDNRDRRVMIVLGVMWVLELGVRWALELTYNYYWKVVKMHPLVQEYLQDSRLTRWCKQWLGWPKDTPSTGRQDWYKW
jgi:hypothetical protein